MRIYGFPEDAQVTFEDIVACVSEAEVERVVQALFGLIRDGKEFNEEFEIRPRNSGEVRVLWSIAQMSRDEHGNAQLVRGILQDITERRQAEKVLRESEKRFATLFHANPAAVAVTQLADNLLVDVNEAWLALTGYAREEAVGFASAALNLWVNPAQRESTIQMLNERGKMRLETQIRTKHGEVRDVLMSGEIVEVAGKRYLLTIAQDISDLKKAELQLRYQANLLANVSEAIIATDRKFTVTYWNAAAERIYGWTAAEVLGKHFLTFVQPQYPDESRRAVMRKIAANGFWEGELRHSRRDGAVFPVQVTISDVKGANGRVVGHVAVSRDISAHLRARDEKARLEDQLRQSQKVEAIGNLAGGVAHDFNNLTAIILGYGEMLLGQLRPEDPLHGSAEQIVAAGRRATTLIRQLLAFSRRQALLPEVFDLHELLLNFKVMLGRLIGEDVELDFELAADPGRIKADPGQIEQVVTNLAVNAHDAMPLGGKLTIETADVELDESPAADLADVVPGRYVLLSLTDTGCGMDKATMTKIFEPFFTTKPKGKGTGLGLATVYGIVKQSNGYIWAESESGVGTSFNILFPWTDEALPARKVEPGAKAPRGNGELILLVEDEVPLRELCSSILSRLGYRVVSAAHGPEALMLVREQEFEPDLVVTDVIMPGMSGAEMVERLLRDRPGLGVLYMSGYPDETIAPHGVLSPDTLLIQKPFTDFALATKVREALARKAVRKPGGVTTPRSSSRVLMIDDDEQYRELVQHFCTKHGHSFAGVDSAAAALSVLDGSAFDVLLVDLNIPGTSGVQILREIRAAGHAAPAIVLTGDVASADMNLLRSLGAVCALEKSSDPEPLLQAIGAA
jgi:PAS domain S-box-containing protein